jgi:hypothetical protein
MQSSPHILLGNVNVSAGNFKLPYPFIEAGFDLLRLSKERISRRKKSTAGG